MLLRASRVLRNNISGSRSLATALQRENVSSETVEYPPIVDDSCPARKERKKLEWHEKIKKIETIEEKLIEINIPRYYGFKCLMLNEKSFPYNTLPFFKYATNTEFVEEPHAAQSEEETKKVETFLNLIKSEIHDALEFELDGYKQSFEIKSGDFHEIDVARVKAGGIVKHLNRILVNALGPDNRHLYESDCDVEPRHEAFWFVGGIEPTVIVRKMRACRSWTRPYANDPVDRPFQYVSQPHLALRHQFPLAPFEQMDFDSLTAPNENIQPVTIDPRALGFFTEHRHGTTIPGFFPGNVREYGLISFQDRKQTRFPRNYTHSKEDLQDQLHSQGIVSSFAWTFAQACYQGFSTYNDMTYPLATQTVITDGQLWSFYKYQLNTTCMHTSADGPNYRHNKCWGTPEMKLYDQIDSNGKLQGLNDDVLKNLIRFYINQPKAREHPMKPFLGVKEKKIADIADVKRRSWLEKIFKTIMSNRPRHRLVPEVYNWEKIYKIDHKTMPLVRKLRFFELGINPFARRLNEHQPEYIPRHLRARGPHDKKKWEATYYPLDHRMNIPRELSHSMLGAPRDPFACKMDRKRKSYK